jgi:hypothetical protein
MAVNKKQKGATEEFFSFINESIDVFEENYQSKFLKVLIEDKKNWAQQIIDIVFPEYFDGYHRMLVDYEISFFRKYRIVADYDDLREIVNDKEKDSLVKEHIFGVLENIEKIELEHQKKDVIKERAYHYFKSQKMKNTLMELAVDWKKNTFDSMKAKLEDALKAGEPKDSGHNYFLDVEKRLKKDFRNPVPILPGLDSQIGGGVAAGELAVVMAPTGGGKSMVLVRSGVTALRAGKKVLYYSLELSEEAVGQRFDACLNNISLKDVWNFKETITETINDLGGIGANLIIKRYPDGAATINNFYSHLDWLKSNENFVPDVIIVDYADNMKALQTYGELRHDLVSIYRDLRALAVEHGVPVLTASQTGRGGNMKQELSLDMIAEAWGKANIADIILGIGRSSEQLKSNEASLKILKNRNGAIGGTFDMFFNTSVLYIEMKASDQLTGMEKRMIVGDNSLERKNKDAVKIDNYMKGMKKETNQSDINSFLMNQQNYTPEIKE